jgi:hypothetical protein
MTTNCLAMTTNLSPLICRGGALYVTIPTRYVYLGRYYYARKHPLHEVSSCHEESANARNLLMQMSQSSLISLHFQDASTILHFPKKTVTNNLSNLIVFWCFLHEIDLLSRKYSRNFRNTPALPSSSPKESSSTSDQRSISTSATVMASATLPSSSSHCCSSSLVEILDASENAHSESSFPIVTQPTESNRSRLSIGMIPYLMKIGMKTCSIA